MATQGTQTLKGWREKLGRLIGRDEDNLQPAEKDRLNQYIQDALRDLYAVSRWEFLFAYYRLELESAVDAGTVAVSAGGTSWTGTGTAWATAFDSAGVAKIRAGGEIYRVASVDSTTGLTTTDAALKALSSEDYYLYLDEISLNTALKSIEAMWVAARHRRLDPMSPSQMADHKSRAFVAGHPQYFAAKGQDASGVRSIELYPIPSTNEILHIQGYKAGTIPTADGGTSDIPDEWQNVVLAGAKKYLYEAKNDDRYGAAVADWERGKLEMLAKAGVNQGPQTISLDPAVHGPERIDSQVTTATLE